MKFRMPFEPKEVPSTCCGDTKKPIFTLVNRHGERSLKQVDELDIPSYINSFEEETNLKAMLKRYSLTGDLACITSRRGGIYADVSSCETNYAKVLDAAREIALLKLQNSSNEQVLSSAAEPAADAAAEPAAEPAEI